MSVIPNLTPTTKKADCHAHTHFSDGTLSVSDLLNRAKSRGLDGFSITDHDTLQAYNAALPLAQTLSLPLVSGIEISAELNGTSVHVLGYAFDLYNAELNQFCQTLSQARTERNLRILEKLKKCKIDLSWDELKASQPFGLIGRPHIAKLMVAKGYVKTMQQAFDLYLGDKARCKVSGCFIEVEQAIHLIQQAGGFAVLAHPHRFQAKKVLKKVLEFPFDGIEVFYANLRLDKIKPWLDHAMKKSLLITGGSDFHGENSYGLDLGTSWTPEDTFDIFMKRLESFDCHATHAHGQSSTHTLA